MPRSPFPSLLLSAALLLGSCGAGTKAQRPDSRGNKLEDLQHEVADLRQQLYLIAANALCNSDVQALMSAVVRSCEKQKAQVCVEPRIPNLVNAVEAEGRFLTLMGSQPYAVFYPDPRKGPFAFDEPQKRRLRLLAQPPWLPTTRFLVAANVNKAGDNVDVAKRRAAETLAELAKLPFPEFTDMKIDASRTFGWVFRFKLQPGEHLRPIDRPSATFRGASLDNSVLIFRTDCRLNEDRPQKSVAEPAPKGAAQGS